MRRLLREWRWQRLTTSLTQVELLVLDVDGVLTDGGLWLDQEGRLQKRFDVRDGLGLKLLQKSGLHLAFLSGGHGGATDVRARQLGIEHCLVGIKDKPPALRALQEHVGVTAQRTAYLGDDLNDLAVRSCVWTASLASRWRQAAAPSGQCRAASPGRPWGRARTGRADPQSTR